MMQLTLAGPPEEPAAARGRERLRRKIYVALAMSLAPYALTPDVLNDAADTVVDELRPSPPALNTRALILRMCDDRPTCWICGFAISLAEEENAPGCFTLDHVVPRSEGGGRLGISNLKPAHRFCNCMRGAKQGRPKTRARYEAFLRRLASGA